MDFKKLENEVELNNATESDAPQTPDGDSNASVDQPDIAEAVSESPTANAKAEQPSIKSEDNSGKMHSVSYLAGGIWKDVCGNYWCREARDNCLTDKVFTDSEYNERTDIQFMVAHGLMKDVVVG